MILEFKYQQDNVYISVDNYTILEVVMQQHASQDIVFDKYVYINYICELLILRDSSFKFINYYEDKCLEDFNSNYYYDFGLEQYVVGKFATNNVELTQYIKYILKIDKFVSLPMVSGVKYQNKLIINQKLVEFNCGNMLYKPQIKESYCKININYNSQAYAIFCNLDDIHALFNQLEISYDNLSLYDRLTTVTKSFNNQLLGVAIIEKVILGSKIKNQCYLPITVHIGEFSIIMLLNKWHNIISQPVKSMPQNDVADIILPHALIHGMAKISPDEASNLELGDVILFDESYAPEHVVCDFGNIIANFELNDDRALKFKSFGVTC